MSFQYYLANVGENRQKLIRGNPSDLLSFSVFEPKKLGPNAYLKVVLVISRLFLKVMLSDS